MKYIEKIAQQMIETKELIESYYEAFGDEDKMPAKIQVELNDLRKRLASLEDEFIELEYE